MGALKADNVLIDGQDLGIGKENGVKLLFDTGTTLMTIPPKWFDKI